MKAILTPFILALLAAYLLNPFIAILEHHGVRRKFVVIAFYAAFGIMAAAAAVILLPKLALEIEDLYTHWPQKLESLRGVAAQAVLQTAVYFPAAAPMLSGWEERVYQFVTNAAAHLPQLASGLLNLLSLMFLVPFLAFFFLVQGSEFTEKILAACPGRHVEKALNIIVSISNSLGNYLRALLLDALCISALAAFGLWMIGLDYSLTLGLLTGVSGLIPYLGPLGMGIIATSLAAVQFHSLDAPLQVVALFMVLRFIDDWLLQPYILSRTVHLHPAVLLLALMVGGKAFGLLGLILAAPTACVLRVFTETLWEWYLTENGMKVPSKFRERAVPLV